MHRLSEPGGAMPDVPSDARLIAALRAGSGPAYDVLVDRHRRSAVLVATELVGSDRAEQVVDLALQPVLTTMLAGAGPDVAFRPYLLAAVVGTAGRRAVAPAEPAEIWRDGSEAGTAMSRVTEQSQLLLWHLDVEGEHPLQVAPLLDVPTSDVPALLRTAREELFVAHPGVPRAAALGPVLLGEAAAQLVADRAPHPSPFVRRSFGSVARVPAARTAAAVTAIALIGAGAVTAAVGAVPNGPDPAGSAARTSVLPIVPAPSGPTGSPTPSSAPDSTVGGSDVSPEALASAGVTQAPSKKPPKPRSLAGGTATSLSPTSSASAAPSADIGIGARSASDGVTWSVSGLPAGASTVVTIVAESGVTLQPVGDDCTGSGSGQLTCTVTAGEPAGSFTVSDPRLGDGQISLSVQPVAGMADPEPGNNDAAVTS